MQSDKVAQIGNIQYDTLQQAINAVDTNDTPTTIFLLKSVSLNACLNVYSGQNIVFNLQNYTISNAITNMPIIENSGTISMSNGTIQTSGTQGAINNNSGGRFYMSGGRIIATGTKQALYNTAGAIAEISGSAYLSNTASERAPVHNVSGGTLTITGGTIVSSRFAAVDNAGTLTIGVKDGSSNVNSPVLQGATYGITNSDKNSLIVPINFYDGIVKYKTAFYNTSKVSIGDKEDAYGYFYRQETIDGQTYQTVCLANGATITFDPNGGNVSETTRGVICGNQIGTLPVPTRAGYEFVGWFTDSQNGVQIDATRVITQDDTFYAHWNRVDIARIGQTTYVTLKAAIDSVAQNNVEVTIELIRDTTENVTVKANQKILLNLSGFTISNTAGSAILENNGYLTITNGTITSDANTGLINNNNRARLIIDGARIVSTGTRQAIYNNNGGIVEIKGNSYLSSTASGKPTTSNMERATVQNLAGGTIYITGGTIIGVNQQAISNEGTLTIGVEDGNVSTTSPNIRGKTYGIKSSSTFNYYDGIIKGKTEAISGSISDSEDNYQIVDGTEVIDGTTYKTVHLETSATN